MVHYLMIGAFARLWVFNCVRGCLDVFSFYGFAFGYSLVFACATYLVVFLSVVGLV